MARPAQKQRPQSATPPAQQGVRRRLPRETRRRQILEAAAEFFAEAGFSGSTRALAERIGVTQALLYRYFPTKQALIDAMFDQLYEGRWDAAWDALLHDRSLGLQERLCRFYEAYLGRSRPVTMRLWVRAGLEGLQVALQRSRTLTDRVLAPVIAELRHEAGLPGFDVAPLLHGERELAMALHGGLIFINIRRYVYRMPMQDEVSDIVNLHVRMFLAGAPAALQALHRGEDVPASLLVEQLPAGGG